MKHFIIKTLTFLAIPILYFGINILINIWLYSNETLTLPDKEILIAGDSHPQKSLNPKYFKSAQNISQPAEPYVLTYWKLEKIFKSHRPDTLILGFAPHNISEYNDLKFSNNKWSSEMFSRSYTIEHFNDIKDKISIDYVTYYKTVWQQIAFYPKKNHTNYIGEYSNSTSSNIANTESAIKRHYFLNKKKLGVSDVAVNYLDSIAKLCDSKDIELVLVSSPVHKSYLNSIPISTMKDYTILKDKYKKKHIIVDKIMETYADSLFLNSDHLNENGANRFTKDIIQFLDKNN